MKCCICGKEIEGYGNNPDGIIRKDSLAGECYMPIYPKESRCCDACNIDVINCRRLLMKDKKWAKEILRIEIH